jgi:hypothetical protein
MVKIVRKTQKIFAQSGGAIGQFGSAQAGTPNLTNDLDDIQALSAYENGWNDAVIDGDKRPPLEEFNAIKYVNDYQAAYQFQEGIAEYDAGTNYFIGSIVKQIGTSILFRSLIDDNLGQALVDGANWKLAGELVEIALIAPHIADTANPHSVTPAQVGNGTAQWNADKLQDFDVSTIDPNDDEYLRYNGTDSEWQPYHRNHAGMQFESNATVTNIISVDTPVKANATYSPESLNGFSHVAGKLTYTGAIAKEFIISLSTSLYVDGQNDKLIHTYIALNGSVVLKSGKSAGSGNDGEGTSISSNLLQVFNNGDFVEVFVENNEGNQDMIVVDLYMTISEL